jgi:hypothetical protein
MYRAALPLLTCGNSVGSGNAVKHSYREIYSSVINESSRCNVLAVEMIFRQKVSRVSLVYYETHAVIFHHKFITKIALEERT